MKRECPTMKGFNRAGIYRMKQIYETYKENKIVSTLLTQFYSCIGNSSTTTFPSLSKSGITDEH